MSEWATRVGVFRELVPEDAKGAYEESIVSQGVDVAKRPCRGCGTDLSGLNPAVKRCSDCCADTMREAELEPLEPFPGAHRPWRCLCQRCGANVSPRYANVHQRGRGCDPCGRRAQAAARRLSQVEAVVTMRAAGLQPLEPYQDSQSPWACRCTQCDSEVSPRYNDVQQGQGGCWDCGVAARSDSQRIPQDKALALARAADLMPLEPYRSNHARWLCKCLTCGRATSPMLTSLQRGSAGCAWCSRHYIHPDEACAIVRAAGLEPLVVYPGANRQWLCRCVNCGGTITPTCYNVSAGHGCRGCSFGGFKESEPAVVYLVTHEGYESTKIGIANEGSIRLKRHQRYGWRVITTLRCSGISAILIEKDILRWWRRELGLPIHLEPDKMPQGGWTETVSSDGIDLNKTINRITAASDPQAA